MKPAKFKALVEQAASEQHEDGTRYVTGEGGGRLVFNTDGSVQVSWVWTAALAADHAKGRRNEAARFTTARKGQPPAESKALSDVLDVRRDATAFTLSEDWREPAAREFLDIHKPLAWRLLHAITTGDANTLRTLAEAVEMAHSITTGSAALNVSPWREIAEAIRSAAESKQDVPTRSEVVAEFNRVSPVNRQRAELREQLARMGFAWLPSPNGRPRVNLK